MTECAYKMKSQQMLFGETQKLSQYMEDLKKQEYEKIHYYFMDLHKELEKREAQLKLIYHDQVKDVEGILNKDILILENRMKEFDQISKKLKEKADRFRMSNDLAIVANAHEVFDLQRKVKNNNFEGKRLELDDEEGLLGESSKFEDIHESYSYQPKKMTPLKSSDKFTKKTKEENQDHNGEHVFFVQLDSELPMPQFLLNISKEKKKIENIGTIKNCFYNSQEQVEENPETERSKMISEVEMHGMYRPPLPQFQLRNNKEEIKEFMKNYQGMLNFVCFNTSLKLGCKMRLLI